MDLGLDEAGRDTLPDPRGRRRGVMSGRGECGPERGRGRSRPNCGLATSRRVAVYSLLDLLLKLILKITASVPDSAMPQWKPPWHDLLGAAASDQP